MLMEDAAASSAAPSAQSVILVWTRTVAVSCWTTNI